MNFFSYKHIHVHDSDIVIQSNFSTELGILNKKFFSEIKHDKKEADLLLLIFYLQQT